MNDAKFPQAVRLSGRPSIRGQEGISSSAFPKKAGRKKSFFMRFPKLLPEDVKTGKLNKKLTVRSVLS